MVGLWWTVHTLQRFARREKGLCWQGGRHCGGEGRACQGGCWFRGPTKGVEVQARGVRVMGNQGEGDQQRVWKGVDQQQFSPKGEVCLLNMAP